MPSIGTPGWFGSGHAPRVGGWTVRDLGKRSENNLARRVWGANAPFRRSRFVVTASGAPAEARASNRRADSGSSDSSSRTACARPVRAAWRSIVRKAMRALSQRPRLRTSTRSVASWADAVTSARDACACRSGPSTSTRGTISSAARPPPRWRADVACGCSCIDIGGLAHVHSRRREPSSANDDRRRMSSRK